MKKREGLQEEELDEREMREMFPDFHEEFDDIVEYDEEKAIEEAAKKAEEEEEEIRLGLKRSEEQEALISEGKNR